MVTFAENILLSILYFWYNMNNNFQVWEEKTHFYLYAQSFWQLNDDISLFKYTVLHGKFICIGILCKF